MEIIANLVKTVNIVFVRASELYLYGDYVF